MQEEISQGAARIAGILGLDNLVMFYDSNDIQLSTETKVVMNEDTAAKYRALGWEVFEINGNDAAQIRKAIEAALHPAETKALYFVAKDNGSGEHFFSSTLADHNKFKDIAAKNRGE